MEMYENKVFVAIADCTGHGIPGAMMTSICSQAINNAILDKRLLDPARILEHVDIYVKNAMASNSKDLTDGMDIGLMAFDLRNETIEYCGAKRPLIYINNEGEVNQIKGIKRSIGEYTLGENIPFLTQELKIDQDYYVYCFSDGIPDQFGGEKGKKLYLKNTINILNENKQEPLKIQYELLEQKMIDWTRNFEIPQTDDMLMFGAKVTPSYYSKMKTIFNLK